MRIGINLLYLIPGKVGGTETYARELIPRLAKNNQLVLFCGREAAATFCPSKNIEIVTIPVNSSNRFARILAEQTLLPWLGYAHKVEIIFSLGYSAPLLHACPSIVTIHDLNWYYHPEDFTGLNRYFWKHLTLLSARFSNHIITDSAASASSIIQVLQTSEEKVTAILHGTPAKVITRKIKVTHPYIFTVVADYPHKNLKTLLQAFTELSQTFPDLSLVVCGLGKQARSTEKITYLGYVTREELAALYEGASLFVFPSAYEGFGYPVLEAMSYGVPVVSSSAFSLREVVGQGGILVDPYDVEGYRVAITSILQSPKIRTDLIKQGAKRVSELKWEDTAEKTLAVLRKGITK